MQKYMALKAFDTNNEVHFILMYPLEILRGWDGPPHPVPQPLALSSGVWYTKTAGEAYKSEHIGHHQGHRAHYL
jgi:hypothetical protein